MNPDEINAGDMIWFPPSGAFPHGMLLTVKEKIHMPPFGPCVWWEDGSWSTIEKLKIAHKITAEFLTGLWRKH